MTYRGDTEESGKIPDGSHSSLGANVLELRVHEHRDLQSVLSSFALWDLVAGFRHNIDGEHVSGDVSLDAPRLHLHVHFTNVRNVRNALKLSVGRLEQQPPWQNFAFVRSGLKILPNLSKNNFILVRAV